MRLLTRAVRITCLLVLPSLASAAEPQPGFAFFEKKVRPVLVEHCYPCHSAEALAAKKLKGGLQLDTRDGLRAGGDSGPVIVAGKPEQSLLIQAVKQVGDLHMPPKGKLTDAAIADLAIWVRMGAPDPRGGANSKKLAGMTVEAGRAFWCYRSIAKLAPPKVANEAWPAHPIDNFILAGLEARKLQPAPDANKATLCRRIHYDLTGLPPTPEEVDSFVGDNDPRAYEKLVDRLLASPTFGEHWGRHWLDVARFAESLTLRGFVLPDAWRYRDYVIDCFNDDLPFDRFVKEQIAGDLLPYTNPAGRRRQVVATAFLAMGNNNLEEQDKKQLRMDVVDEMLDVVSKGFLAQTVTCARCHDHKFDPIPTRDYYALAGILRNAKAMEHANVSKWIETPLPADPPLEAAIREREERIATLEKKIKEARAVAAKQSPPKGALAAKDVPGVVVDDTQAKKVGAWMDSTHFPTFIGTGYTHDKDAGKGEKTLTFAPESLATGRYEVHFAYSPGTNRAEAVPVTVFSADGEKTITVNMRQTPPIDGRFISLGEYRFEKTGQSFVLVANEGTQGHVTADAMVFLPVGTAKPVASSQPEKSASAGNELKTLEQELKALKDSGPKRPLGMSVVEEDKIEDAHVHVRGLVARQGELAPRGFLQVASRGAATPLPRDQSGRKELAEWIASPDNPLTARVIVNRAWHWLFGAGIVRTVDNFGTTGETPSHPEMLDYLATRFIDDGWSIKKLVRQLVLSRTYRQSSVSPESDAVKADPENRLLGRANRRLLTAESLRDTILSVSGKLDATRGGGPGYPTGLAADYGYQHTSNRRSIYLPVFRNALPGLFEAFDFADPSVVTGQRNASTVATQALFMLNNPFPIEQARHAADRLLGEKLADDKARITRAYRLTLGRQPTMGERQVARRFVAHAQDEREAWAALFQALFASADFRYLE